MYSGDQQVTIERLDSSVYVIPTDFPESDGTLAWDRTTLVIVEATAGGRRSLGYTYADMATARLIKDLLAGVVLGRDAMAVSGAWAAMVHAIRNLGRPGIVSMAISAVDAALSVDQRLPYCANTSSRRKPQNRRWGCAFRICWTRC